MQLTTTSLRFSLVSGEGLVQQLKCRVYWLVNVTTPNHYTTETDNAVVRKSLSFYSFSMKLPPAR